MYPEAFGDEDIDQAFAMALEMAMEDLSPGGRLPVEYAMASGIDDPDDFDPEKSGDPDGFRQWAAGRIEERLNEEVFRLSEDCERLGDGRLVLWRALCVPGGWLDGAVEDRPVGVYWASDREFAEPHWGEGFDRPDWRVVRLKGAVRPEGVDWVTTLALNAVADYTVGEEREVRLLPSCEVEIIGADVRLSRGSYSPAEFRPGMVLPAGEATPYPAP